MPLGPGKYDDLCTYVRENAKAAGAIVIVIRGDKGSGFACQTEPDVLLALPAILESMAAELRAGRQ